ncbi:hypothetical protein [Roseimaritima ulvae]|uniref:Uncharacterized protein n=1 Tax=Roseimaritima ulvae TaxID=980254 RepID=A0A5B9QZG7_9BACT|nr:hypothetical protein [Roseimaritima ulvae]QEG39391.1 hypothetical protein UC8_13680 [Roseimaritima ulvae]
MPKTKRPSTRSERKAKQPTRLPQRFEPKFLEQADGRQVAVREIKKRLNVLMADVGADSYQKELLVRRAIFISVQLETMEVNAAEGGMFDMGVYTQAVNALSGLLTKLGMEKSAPDVVDLSDYLKTSGAKR